MRRIYSKFPLSINCVVAKMTISSACIIERFSYVLSNIIFVTFKLYSYRDSRVIMIDKLGIEVFHFSIGFAIILPHSVHDPS
jgi:hypothetical protein